MFKALFLAAVISLAIFTPITDAAPLNCAAVSVQDKALYNVCPFSRHGTYHAERKAIPSENPEEAAKEPAFNLDFSFPFANVPGCGTPNAAFATTNVTKDNQKVCSVLLDKQAKRKFRLLNETNDATGFTVYFENPKIKEDQNAYELIINVYCNKNVSTKAETVFQIVDKTQNLITLEAQSPFGCPYMSTSMLEKFIALHRWLYAAILFFAGLFLLVLGITMFKYAMFLITTLAVTVTLGVLFFTFVTAETKDVVLYILFFICLAIGLGVGYVAVRYKKYGFLGLGIAAGILVGLFLSTLIQPLIQGKVEAKEDSNESKGSNEWVFYVIIAICGAIGGFLMYYFRKNVTIIFTSFIGSYLIVRAISIFGKHFPNEIALIRGSAKLDVWGYGYLALMIVISILGIYIQHVLKKRRDAEEEHIKQLGYSQAPNAEYAKA